MGHNAPCLPPALKNKNCISIVFNFSWDDCDTQVKSETMHGYVKFWWVNKVHCGLCENADWNVTWFSAGSGGGGLLLDDSKSGLVWTKIGWELLFCTLITFLGTRLYSCSVSMCVFMLFRQCILHSYFVVIFFSEILLLSITFVLKGKYYLNCFCIFSVPRFAISSTTGLEVEKRPFNTVKN